MGRQTRPSGTPEPLRLGLRANAWGLVWLALFVGFGDSALNFELRVWVREIQNRLQVRSSILTDIDRRFREAGIEIPFPQRDLHVRSVDRDVMREFQPPPQEIR